MQTVPVLLLFGVLLLLLPACANTPTQPEASVSDACTTLAPQGNRAYDIYFTSHTATINRRDRQAATNVAMTFLKGKDLMITVLGYADRVEGRELGWRRARAIAGVLTAAGVPADMIFAGSADAPTPPKTSSKASRQYRKVSITPRIRSDNDGTNTCMSAIRRRCFRPLDADQQHDCDDALALLAPATAHVVATARRSGAGS